jgi:ankyrin repeat protein
MVQALLDQAPCETEDGDGDGADNGEADGYKGDAKYLNIADHMGNTPLHLAVEKNREAMIRFLLAKGAGA